MNEVNMEVPLDPALMLDTQQLNMHLGMGMPMSFENQQQMAMQGQPNILDPNNHEVHDTQNYGPETHSHQPNSLDDPNHHSQDYAQQQQSATPDHDLASQPTIADALQPPPTTTTTSSAEPPTAAKNDSPTKSPVDDSDDKEYALPLLRQLALELGKDRPKNGDLSKESRIAIVAAVAAGQSKNAVAEAFGISPSTVRRALERWQTRHSNASRPKPGRKPKLTQEDELLLVQAAQTQPGASLKELGAQYGVCYATAKTVLKKHRAGRYSDLPPDPPPEATAGAP